MTSPQFAGATGESVWLEMAKVKWYFDEGAYIRATPYFNSKNRKLVRMEVENTSAVHRGRVVATGKQGEVLYDLAVSPSFPTTSYDLSGLNVNISANADLSDRFTLSLAATG